ncbi:MAG: biotin/lipoyl-containing protein [Bdellovibrionia bacterium]
MSILQTRVGSWSFKWKSVPRGNEGTASVEVTQMNKASGVISKSNTLTVSWRRDADGIRLILPDGTHGFDLQGQKDDDGGTQFNVTKRGSHLEWTAVPFAYGERETQANQRAGVKKAIRVRAQMPGKILRIMVVPGQMVEKGQPIVLMEAMKMENEIRAIQAGKVSQVKVTEGQAVETGADLVLFET